MAVYMYMCLCIYKCKLQPFYLFFHQWTFRLFLCPDYCNTAALDIEMKISFQINVFISFGHILKSRITGSHGSSIFNFFEDPPYCFPQFLYQFIIQSAGHKCSLFSKSMPTFVISCLFVDGCSNRDEVISHSWF